MFFYAFGSLLFALAMLSALSVMAVDFAHYHRAMMKALRGLSLDGLAMPAATRQTPQITRTVSPLTRAQSQAAA